MLSKNRNTSVYLQYANVRIRSVPAKADQDLTGARVLLGHPVERAPALALIRFPEAVGGATAGYVPRELSTYLYEQCPVLDAEDPGVRDSRLLLAQLTSKTLTLGYESPWSPKTLRFNRGTAWKNRNIPRAIVRLARFSDTNWRALRSESRTAAKP